jgi:glycine/D-amino acid oxidase-like deaminating enzyme
MRTADVCVVGGGLIGTATAYYAARAGLKVVLVEERELASGTSGVAFGGVSLAIYSYASARVPSTYVELSKTSLSLYERAQQEIGSPLDLDAPGSIDPFYNEEDSVRGLERARGLKACGVPVEFIDYQQIKEIEPAVAPIAIKAIYCPVDAHVTPMGVVWAFTKAAKQRGAEFLTYTKAERLISHGDRVTGVVTTAGEISADTVVCASGSGIPALAAGVGVQVPLDLARGQMFVTERIPPLLRTYVHNIKQTPSGTIVFGTTREPGVKDTTVTSVEGTHKMLKWASSLVPALAKVKLLRSWAGLRLLPPDGYPIIGRPKGVDGLLLAVLHRGVTLAPAVGKILTDLMTEGMTPHDISPYRLERFAPGAVGAEAQETFYGT